MHHLPNILQNKLVYIEKQGLLMLLINFRKKFWKTERLGMMFAERERERERERES